MHVDVPQNPSRLAPLVRPLERFLALESAGGIVLLICAVIALVWANSPWKESYDALWHSYLSIKLGVFEHKMSLAHWVNDGLMVLFFLLVGLEIKREVLFGELRSLKRAALPIAAAIGGMVVPAGIYVALNSGGGPDAMRGWGVPMATDIAFAVGVLALVGRGVPLSLKVFLLAVAIVDDLGAVLVIAIFYTSHVSIPALATAGAVLVGLIALNRLGVHRPLPYLVLGVVLWAATLLSGVHATIAGVLLAFTIPASRPIEEERYLAFARGQLDDFEKDVEVTPDQITPRQSASLMGIEQASQAVQTTLARVEHPLVKPVNFLIVPLFALANAGVTFSGDVAAALTGTVTLGVFLGLFMGKQIGVMLLSGIAVATGLANRPAGATWAQVYGISCLCGIGFTMSLFIATLAFGVESPLLTQAKVGILAASLLSGVLGAIVLRVAPHATIAPITSS
jgi:Na+:H+ antiporter, NhaA family